MLVTGEAKTIVEQYGSMKNKLSLGSFHGLGSKIRMDLKNKLILYYIETKWL